jgi:hypothetical protein
METNRKITKQHHKQKGSIHRKNASTNQVHSNLA